MFKSKNFFLVLAITIIAFAPVAIGLIVGADAAWMVVAFRLTALTFQIVALIVSIVVLFKMKKNARRTDDQILEIRRRIQNARKLNNHI